MLGPSHHRPSPHRAIYIYTLGTDTSQQRERGLTCVRPAKRKRNNTRRHTQKGQVKRTLMKLLETFFFLFFLEGRTPIQYPLSEFQIEKKGRKKSSLFSCVTKTTPTTRDRRVFWQGPPTFQFFFSVDVSSSPFIVFQVILQANHRPAVGQQ